MRKSGTAGDRATARATATAWMSLKDASDLTGTSRAELRSRIAAGELTSRTIKRGDKVEHRLTRAALAEVGLIGAPHDARPEVTADAAPSSPAPATAVQDAVPSDAIGQLIALIREQNQRIASLEDQRAQLAARLGATVEAMHQLEDRLEAILDARSAPTPQATDGGALPVTTDDGLVITPASPRPPASGGLIGPTRDTRHSGACRSLARLVREVAQPRLRELTGGPRREATAGD